MRRFSTVLFITLLSWLMPAAGSDDNRFVVASNDYYVSIIDCSIRTPVAVVYSLTKDEGNAKRHPSYIDDVNLKKQQPNCHPLTNHRFKTYQSVLTAKGVALNYDVGHLAMSNHLDHNSTSSKLANQFSNLAPQAAAFNRKGGAWYGTEMIIECHRDVEPVLVFAGTIDNPATTELDFFTDVFGQTTPDYWWRVVYWQKSNLYKAWLMPNADSSTESRLYRQEYDVDIATIKAMLNFRLEPLEQIILRKAQLASKTFIKTDTKGSKLNCRGTVTDVG